MEGLVVRPLGWVKGADSNHLSHQHFGTQGILQFCQTPPKGKGFLWSMPAPLWEGRQLAEAALVRGGTTVPLSLGENNPPSY